MAGLRRAGRPAAERRGEAAPHRHVQDDEEAVVGGVGPGRRVHLIGRHRLVVDAVDVEADRLGAGRAVPLHGVGVEAGLAGGVGAGGRIAQARRLVAGAAGGRPAVHGGPGLVDAVDVLHDVELADARPVLVVAAVGRAQHPEGGPVAGGRGAGDVGHLDARLDAQLAAGRGLEVGAVGLDAARGPVAGRVAQRRDLQVAASVEGDVAGAAGHPLDLAGAPVGGAAGVGGPGVVEPVGGVDAGAGRAVEVVGEDLCPARGGRGRGGVRGLGGGRGEHGRQAERAEGGDERASPSGPAGGCTHGGASRVRGEGLRVPSRARDESALRVGPMCSPVPGSSRVKARKVLSWHGSSHPERRNRAKPHSPPSSPPTTGSTR